MGFSGFSTCSGVLVTSTHAGKPLCRVFLTCFSPPLLLFCKLSSPRRPWCLSWTLEASLPPPQSQLQWTDPGKSSIISRIWESLGNEMNGGMNWVFGKSHSQLQRWPWSRYSKNWRGGKNQPVWCGQAAEAVPYWSWSGPPFNNFHHQQVVFNNFTAVLLFKGEDKLMCFHLLISASFRRKATSEVAILAAHLSDLKMFQIWHFDRDQLKLQDAHEPVQKNMFFYNSAHFLCNKYLYTPLPPFIP